MNTINHPAITCPSPGQTFAILKGKHPDDIHPPVFYPFKVSSKLLEARTVEGCALPAEYLVRANVPTLSPYIGIIDP